MSILVESKKKVNTENVENNKILTTNLKQSKKFILCLDRAKKSPLDFAQNLIYSFLIRSSASVLEISKQTGLDRKQAIPNALKKLAELGLVEINGNSYSALPPADPSWFSPFENKKSKNWYDSFNYYKVFIISGDCLSTRQNLLFAKILNFPRQLPAGYAALTGIPKRTVFRLIKELRKLHLLSPVALFVPDEIPDYWVDIIKAKTFFSAAVADCVNKINGNEEFLKWNSAPKIIEEQSQRILDHGWHNKTFIRNLWHSSFAKLQHQKHIEIFLYEFPNMLDHILTNGKTKGFLVSTTELFINFINSRDANSSSFVFLRFDPALLLK